MRLDISNAYIYAGLLERKEVEDRIMIKMMGALVDQLAAIEPESYIYYVVLEKGVRTLNVVITKLIYGMLIRFVLWHERFKSNILSDILSNSTCSFCGMHVECHKEFVVILHYTSFNKEAISQALSHT